MTSTWTPPPGPPPVIPGPGMPPPHKPNGSKRALIALSAVTGLAAVIAATAAITYSVTRQPAASTSSTVSSTAMATGGPEQQAAAKKRVCELFDAGTRGQAGKGGARVDGQLNVPAVLRMLNTGAAIESALNADVPAEVDQAAHDYVARVFDLTTEALSESSTNVDRLNQLNADTNKAIDSLLDACGLPR